MRNTVDRKAKRSPWNISLTVRLKRKTEKKKRLNTLKLEGRKHEIRN